MKILIVGGGGREHAIAWKLAQRPDTQLICAPGNAGIADLCECVPVSATDIDGMVALAAERQVDLVVVAPDDPLAAGMVDALEAKGIPAFGPTAAAACLESSKIFSKNLMQKYNIPTARWASFDSADEALAYIRSQGAPIVVKADGLALGKGVVVAETVEQAENAVREMMEDKKFAGAGARVVIEEKLTGPEVTVLAFADGQTVRVMPPSRDHKPIFDGNLGPNTGGMGAISPAPGYTEELAARCAAEIFEPTIRAMAAEGRPFKGVLYFGLMLTPNGPRVIEYNARFGDPETQAVLMLLDSDLAEIFLACRNGTLDQVELRWKEEAACCVVLASAGYPGTLVQKGCVIEGLPQSQKPGHMVFHAGTARDETGRVVTSGGRVLGVTALAPTLREAIDAAYADGQSIRFDGMQYRKDIGRI